MPSLDIGRDRCSTTSSTTTGAESDLSGDDDDDSDSFATPPPSPKRAARMSRFRCGVKAILLRFPTHPFGDTAGEPEPLVLAGDISDHYLLSDQIGSGAFAEVLLGVHAATGSHRAIKRVDKRLAGDVRWPMQEGNILKMLSHPNIVQLYEIFEDDRHISIVTELGAGGELFTRLHSLGRLPELDAAVAMRDLLVAVTYIHQKDIVHRDLKPDNLVLQSDAPVRHNVLKVIDFGVARPCRRNTVLHSLVGTAYYTAPEVLARRYGRSCDLWSAGAIMYVLLSGSAPFQGKHDLEIMQRVRAGKYDFNKVVWTTVSAEAKELIQMLMKVTVKARWTAEQALQSRWISVRSPWPADLHRRRLR